MVGSLSGQPRIAPMPIGVGPARARRSAMHNVHRGHRLNQHDGTTALLYHRPYAPPTAHQQKGAALEHRLPAGIRGLCRLHELHGRRQGAQPVAALAQPPRLGRARAALRLRAGRPHLARAAPHPLRAHAAGPGPGAAFGRRRPERPHGRGRDASPTAASWWSATASHRASRNSCRTP